ncbi:MAG: cation diffusion facilitator family transporter [Clostridia bacterium]
MKEESLKIKNNVTRKVSILGVCANLILLIIKLIVGVNAKSYAMMADALNSAGDIFNAFMSYIGNKRSNKPKDKDHPYGHGKEEYIFAVLIGISMVIAGATMFKNAISGVINHETLEFSIWLIVVCVVTVVIKYAMYLYARFQSKKVRSILVNAIKQDNKNDILVTIGTFLGIVASINGFYFVDGIVGAITSIWVVFVGINIFKEAHRVLNDTGLDDSSLNEIQKEIEKRPVILNVDNIASKPVGDNYIVIVEISMDKNKTLEESHDIGNKVEEELKEKFDYIYDAIVHINPK